MLLVSASVKPSGIHGLGCFTNEPIKKGQLVWTFTERFDQRLPLAEVKQLPQAAQDFLRMYGYHEDQTGQKMVVLCGDHSRHMNHSDDPNLSEEPNGDNVARRDIVVGEELTCNYYAFDLDTAAKLSGSIPQLFNPPASA